MSQRHPPHRPLAPVVRFAGAALLAGAGAGLLGGCSEAPELGLGGMSVAPDVGVAYRGPTLSSEETAQMDRCVALMTPMLRGHAVRSTAAARGGEGLEYVWVNADMHDDAEDIERRNAAGATVGGHCQFDDGGDAVHVHAYQLDLEAGATSGYPAYRYVAGLGDTDSARTASAAD